MISDQHAHAKWDCCWLVGHLPDRRPPKYRMVVSKRETDSWPGAVRAKLMVGMYSTIWLTTFSFFMMRAVDRASMALAPQPFLPSAVNVHSPMALNVHLLTGRSRSSSRSAGACRSEMRIRSIRPMPAGKPPLRRLSCQGGRHSKAWQLLGRCSQRPPMR